jgi:hypothetical protein
VNFIIVSQYADGVVVSILIPNNKIIRYVCVYVYMYLFIYIFVGYDRFFITISSGKLGFFPR